MKCKKFFALLLSLCMVFSTFVTVANADALTTITVGEVEAGAGEDVVVPVSISNNTVGICGLTMTFTYDANVLTYKSATQGDALTSLTLTKPGSGYTPGAITFAMDAMDADFSNGTVINITFEVAAGTTAGDKAIDVAIDTLCGYDFNDIPYEAIGGKVAVAGEKLTTITVGEVAGAKRGEEVVVPVSISNNTLGVCGLTMTFTYDTNVLTYVNAAQGDALTSLTLTKPGSGYTPGAITFAMDSMDADFSNGTVINITFKVNDAAKGGDHAINVTIDTLCDYDFNDISYEAVDGKVNVDAPHEHEWGEGVVTTPATHTTAGVKTYTCPCGEQKTETIAPDASTHEWDEGVITTPATHTQEGVKTYTCPCGEQKTEAIDKTPDHEWDEGVITTPATCTEDGVKTYTCPCGETYTETIDATGHSHGDWEKDDDVNHKKVCSCGDTIVEEHTWNNGEITTKPTYGKDGVKTYTCPICKGTKTEAIPMKDAQETDINIVAGEVTARAGQEIRIPVSISNNSGITGLQLGFDYDPNLLTLTSVEKGEALAGLEFTEPGDFSDNSLVFLWDGLEADSTNGDILYLNFTVSNTALGGKYVPVVYVIMTADQDAQEVPVYVTNGTVNVIEYTHGDVDGDGEVDVQDIVFLRRELVGGYDQTITAEAGDVYKDGDLNVQDVVYLRRFVIGGYDIELPVWPENN